MSVQNVTQDMGRLAQHGARQAAPWVERLARLGYVAKGIVFGLIGVLALEAALGLGGKATDQRGVLHTIAAQPFGRFILGVIGLGLAGYALWRFIQAALDPEYKTEGQGAKGWLRRVGCVLSGLAYAGLAATAFALVRGVSSGGSGGDTETYTARALAAPLGQWLVGAAGLTAIGVGIYQAVKAFQEKFVRDLQLEELDETGRRTVVMVGKVGLIARGVVFALVGWFLIRAALTANAGEARGLDGALAALLQHPFGPVLLGIVAAGLVAYGAYCLAESRWRHVPTGKVATAAD